MLNKGFMTTNMGESFRPYIKIAFDTAAEMNAAHDQLLALATQPTSAAAGGELKGLHEYLVGMHEYHKAGIAAKSPEVQAHLGDMERWIAATTPGVKQ